jgi:hypothetical protein
MHFPEKTEDFPELLSLPGPDNATGKASIMETETSLVVGMEMEVRFCWERGCSAGFFRVKPR